MKSLRILAQAQQTSRLPLRSPATTALRPVPSTQRTFLSNPLAPSIQTITATRTLPYPSRAIYSIIADVPRYSDFLPYCQSSSITRWSNPDADGKKWPEGAKIVVGWNNINETFYSKIYCVPGKIVEAVGGKSKTTLSKDQVAHHTESAGAEAQGGEETAADQSILTHLLTRWTVSPFVYKPPPALSTTNAASANAPEDPSESESDLPAKEQTEVHLSIEYQFANPIYATMSAAVAPKVAGKMIEAFEKRVAQVLDGPGWGGTDKRLAKLEGGLNRQSP